MGYRSEVAFILEFHTKKQAQDCLSSILYKIDHTEKPEWNWDYMPSLFSVKGKYLLFEAGSLKWYESYPDVRFLEKIYKDYEDHGGCIGSRFVRVGEEAGDVEIDNYGDSNDLWDFVDISQSIDISYPRELEDKEDEPDA